MSVFYVVDLGSKLNDPMNTLAPSTANVLRTAVRESAVRRGIPIETLARDVEVGD